MVRALFSAFVLFASISTASAQPMTQAGLDAFLREEIRPQARAAGIPESVLDAALGGAKLMPELPDLQRPGEGDVEERNFQAEFKSGAAYLSEASVAANARIGRGLVAEHRALLDRIEARYGVPAEIVVAIWGRESAFGRADIPHDVFSVLSTKAYLSRRRDLFRGELLAALKIAARSDRSVDAMRSSWAGALGQPQFMPSNYLEHAVDFDGDGRADIWSSVPDTLASIANYLADAGWREGRDWGFEVELAPAVACEREGPDRMTTVGAFARAGVERVAGRTWSAGHSDDPATLVLPAGRFGPAFVVTPNFYVIKDYNESDLYALFVGHAADRMRGARSFVGDWRRTDALTRGDVARMQAALIERGYDTGGADGLAGYKTRRSIGAFQAAEGLPQTCWPTARLARQLAR